MQLLSFVVVLAGFTNVAMAHYRFAWLNGGAEYQNIRKNTNFNSPITVLSDPNLRCNEGGLSGSSTTVLTVAAGGAVTFKVDTPVYHQGPVQWYLGKAPSDVTKWDGSGANWFKFKAEGPTFSGGQATWPMRDTYTTNLPSSIPAGQYLLRIEQLAIHNPGAEPQFYISCAQINVTGGGSANPSKFSIPGHISANDPGYTANIYNNFVSYSLPGPAVWQG